jgi:hypothetical protein
MKRKVGAPDPLDSLKNRFRIAKRIIAALSLATSATLPLLVPGPSTARHSAPQKVERTKVAEGEYSVYQRESGGAVGPFENAVFSFRESWTLWRTRDAKYEVEGERRFESPKDEPHRNRFQARLTHELRIESVKEYAKLRWRPDSGPLTCEFSGDRLHCSSNAKDPHQKVELEIPMRHTFGLLWPISPFSLSGITRAAGRCPNDVTPVQLVEVVEESVEAPVSPLVLDGHLRYLGQEEIRMARRKWRADKFALDVPLHPGYLIWTSPEGILLSLAVDEGARNEPPRRLDLVRYEKFANY